MQRFYFLNDWFIDDNGDRRSKEDIWNEIQQETEKRQYEQQLKQSEQFITLQFPSLGEERPTDYVKLAAVLNKHTDKVLYDWYSILSGLPTVFYTKPPGWLTDKIGGYPRKCNDLWQAIAKRLQDSDSLLILLSALSSGTAWYNHPLQVALWDRDSAYNIASVNKVISIGNNTKFPF